MEKQPYESAMNYDLSNDEMEMMIGVDYSSKARYLAFEFNKLHDYSMKTRETEKLIDDIFDIVKEFNREKMPKYIFYNKRDTYTIRIPFKGERVALKNQPTLELAIEAKKQFYKLHQIKQNKE